MSVTIRPLAEVSHRARRVLLRELGPVDAIRFLNQFRTGGGDYTSEREALFAGESTAEILADIRARRNITGATGEDQIGDAPSGRG